jgi:uncharacterized membrane protein YkvA (DUF1232 family)
MAADRTGPAAFPAPTLLAVSWWQGLLVGLGVTALVWGAGVAVLVMLGRRSWAVALARFVPDCIVLFRRLLADDRVPRRRRLALWALLGYVALPFDLVPDVIPVAGQLDDVVVVALVLRFVLRGSGRALLAEHWPGPPESLAIVTRAAFGPGAV